MRHITRPRPRLTLALALLLAGVTLGAVFALPTTTPAGAQQGDGPEPPARPGGLKVATEAGSLDVSLDWRDVDGAVDYLVRWRSVDNKRKLNDGVRFAASEAAISVDAAGEWVVRVQACNAAGCGDPRSRRFTLEPAVAPGDPLKPRDVQPPDDPPAAGDPIDLEDVEPAGEPTATPEPTPPANRAPQVNPRAANLNAFIQPGNAPRGKLVSKPFDGIFTDPDGDALTYTVSASTRHRALLDLVVIHDRLQRVYFRASAEGDWDAVSPALPNPIHVNVTLTATDPGGLAASVPGVFLVSWDPAPACQPAAPSGVSAQGIARAAVVQWQAPDADDACEPAAYVVETRQSSSGGAWRQSNFLPPSATHHVAEQLAPGRHDVRVRAVHAQSPGNSPRSNGPGSGPPMSDAPVNAQQITVPADCSVILTMPASDGFSEAENQVILDGDGITGSWISGGSHNNGCEAGGVWVEEKGPSETTWTSQWTTNGQEDLRAFAQGGGPSTGIYEYRVTVVDGRRLNNGVQNLANINDAWKHSSNIVHWDYATGSVWTGDADTHSPTSLSVEAANNTDIFVTWGQPASTPGSASVTGYVVEWRTLGATSWVTSDTYPGYDAHGTLVPLGASSSDFRILKTHVDRGSTAKTRTPLLDDQTDYEVRVGARFSGGNASAYTAPALVRTWYEPLRVWFADNTPNFVSGRIFMYAVTNKPVVSVVCYVGGTMINCPPANLVSLAVPGSFASRGDKVVVRAEATLGDASGSTRIDEFVREGPHYVETIRASAGNGKLAVGWTGPPQAVTGAINGYVVQARTKDAMGAWVDWTEDTEGTDANSKAVLLGADARDHLFTGLSNGEWQVRVRAQNNANDTDDDTNILGATSETLSLTLASSRTAGPGAPTNISVTPGDGKLVVEWDPPASGSVHGYAVRHKKTSSANVPTNWTEVKVYPPDLRRICSNLNGSCVNPRKAEIAGLTNGTRYTVEVYSLNANGRATQRLWTGIRWINVRYDATPVAP